MNNIKISILYKYCSMSKTYRYKIFPAVLEELIAFASVHRFDEPQDFKDSWDEWVKENNELISREKLRLENLGYKGNVTEKMYKSIRYYYKNKSMQKTEPVKRRKYISLDKKLVENIDTFIDTHGIKKKPSDGFNEFMEKEEYKNIIATDKNRLQEKGITEDDFNARIKKTYKNRYFIRQKKGPFILTRN